MYFVGKRPQSEIKVKFVVAKAIASSDLRVDGFPQVECATL